MTEGERFEAVIGIVPAFVGWASIFVGICTEPNQYSYQDSGHWHPIHQPQAGRSEVRRKKGAKERCQKGAKKGATRKVPGTLFRYYGKVERGV